METQLDTNYSGVKLLFSELGLEVKFEEQLFGELNADICNNNQLEYDLFIFLNDQLRQEELVTLNLLNNSFFISYEQYYQIEKSERDNYFELPAALSGSLKLQVKGINIHDNEFSLRVYFYAQENNNIPVPFKCKGGLIEVRNQLFQLNEDEFHAFKFHETYRHKSENEFQPYHHLELVSLFKKIASDRVKIDASRYDSLQISSPSKVGLNLTELEDGDLSVKPNIIGVGTISEELLERELDLYKKDSTYSIIYNNNELITLSENQKKAIDEIIKKPIIRKEEKKDFFRSPGSFYNGDLIDLESGFSMRVSGIVEYTRVSFIEMTDDDNDWFIRDQPLPVTEIKNFITNESDLDNFVVEFENAKESKSTSLIFNETKIDISDSSEVNNQIEKLRDQFSQEIENTLDEEVLEDESETRQKKATATYELEEQKKISLVERFNQYSVTKDVYSTLKYPPKNYQREGIDWIYSLFRSSLETKKEIQGGILADDMGLGKTFTSLVAMSAIRRYLLDAGGVDDKPFLVVAPLSLLQNWKDEIAKFFKASPFSDIVILNAQEELSRFRLQQGNEKEQVLDSEGTFDVNNLRYCLKIGNQFPDRLDKSGRLVITTYHTLRDFQFSLGRIPWSCIVFDEAQNIKNPNTLWTRAAKALNADLKILATGTPVENKLEEYWCIMDTACPNLFGDRKHFVSKYVRPMKYAQTENEKISIGKALYKDSKPFLLRRVKEDVLTDLPPKNMLHGIQLQDGIYDEQLDQILTDEQHHLENEVRNEFRINPEPGAALKGLHGIKNCYLHPKLTWNAKTKELRNLSNQLFWGSSARLIALKSIIERVRDCRNDKLIIFTTYRAMQHALAKRIRLDFNVEADIISGDTKTNSNFFNETRKGIIQNFEQLEGFQILILSPIAAGVGLNITAANHVFHLDRHWNPAKEAQANDRVYRIGQEKEVYIYYPISKSMNGESFDIKMNKLLSRKIGLKDALLTYPANLEKELAEEYF